MECSLGAARVPGTYNIGLVGVKIQSCLSSSSASRNFASRSASTSTAFPALRSKDVRAMPAGKEVLHMRGRAQHILIKRRKKPHCPGWLRLPEFVKVCGPPSRIVDSCRRTIRPKEPAGQVDPSLA